MLNREQIVIIGGGPAGLIAADVLAPHCEVHLYEQGRSVGRKFLVAGQGGFNLTNSLDGPELAAMYTPTGFLDEALARFGSAAMRAWLLEMGIDTYVGSSGRVFPNKGIKPIDVLNAIRTRLVERGVQFHLEHTFIGFDADHRPIIEHHGERASILSHPTLFALGGASWTVTGSTGTWPQLFAPLGIDVAAFQPSNCGVNIAWPEQFARDHAGKALKNIGVKAGDRVVTGEATITVNGLEGNAIYPVVPELREALNSAMPALVRIDLKPFNTVEQVLERIAGKEPRNYGAGLNLDRAAMALLKTYTTRDQFLSPWSLAHVLKDLPVPVSGLRPIEEAISTIGGIRPQDLAGDFSFIRHPHLFALGEMVDWDAPTGGFLLQGCFAMGYHAAQAIVSRVSG
jgi:uncharacterized flavoprotein (TIGR03862 family)